MDHVKNNLKCNDSQETGISVNRRKYESFEDLMRRFKKKYVRSGLVKETRDLMFYDKPSIKRRKKRAAAQRARIRDEQKKINKFDKFKKERKIRNANNTSGQR